MNGSIAVGVEEVDLETLPRFTSGVLDEHSVRSLIDAALAAPGLDPKVKLAFVVVQKSNLIHHVLHDPWFESLHRARNLIWICSRGRETIEREESHWAAEHLLLAAHHMGMQAVARALPDDPALLSVIQEKFLIPEDYSPMIPIGVGYSEHPERIHHRKRSGRILAWLR